MKAIAVDSGATILNWASNIEEEALKQAENCAKHPCVDGRIVLCPDAHAGYGVPIGCVFPTRDAIIPSAVGVDIGCTMSACKTNVKVSDISEETLKEIWNDIRKTIPVGFNHHSEPQDASFFDDSELWGETIVTCELLDELRFQIGTLGGGNHFIELQKDENDFLWFMIHSGSRGLGKKVGDYYIKQANDLCKAFKQDEVVNNNLAFLPKSHELYEFYIKEMYACMNFASQSHDLMSDVIIDSIEKHFPDLVIDDSLSTIHNFVKEDDSLIIHRKGAIYAGSEVRAIIPGSQGTCSYIVQGLGNKRAYKSASHGAGRKLSRKRAKNELSLEAEQKKMQGILNDLTTNDKLDEAPSAYKNIEDVLQEESDLVKPIIKLQPIAVIKA